MSRPILGLAALVLVLLATAPTAHAQSNLANCKFYTKVQQDFRQGLAYCEKCIEDEPENPEARFFGAWCLAEVGEWDQAWESFNWLMDQRNSKSKKMRKHAKFARDYVRNYFVTHFNNGVALLNEQDYRGARDEFEITTRIWPTKSEGFLNYGYALSQLDNHELAIEAFRSAVAIDTTQSTGYEYLSSALGNYRAALQAEEYPDSALVAQTTVELEGVLQKVLLFKPENDAALLQLGDIAVDAGRTEEGIDLLVRSVRISPENVTKLYNVGIGFYERDQYTTSARVFRLVTEELDDPADTMWLDAMFNLGLSQLYDEDYAGCVLTMERLKEVNPAEPDYYRILGSAYRGAGDTKKASENVMKYDELLRAREEG